MKKLILISIITLLISGCVPEYYQVSATHGSKDYYSPHSYSYYYGYRYPIRNRIVYVPYRKPHHRHDRKGREHARHDRREHAQPNRHKKPRKLVCVKEPCKKRH